MIRIYGFDDTLYNTVGMNYLTQMHRLVVRLLTFNIAPELRAKLEALKPPLGQAIAISSQGDHTLPTLQEAVIPSCLKIRAIYDDLNRIVRPKPALKMPRN